MASIDYDRLNIKLNAILNKDVALIKARNTKILFLDDNYTIEQLQAWLDDRFNILDNYSKYSLAQIETFRTSIYNQLCDTCKLQADDILDGVNFVLNPCDAQDYLRLCGIILYKWVYIP